MALIVTAIGSLSKDPSATSTGSTIWKMRCFGKEITLFSNDDPADARSNFRSGQRIRGQGKAAWNEFNEEWSITLNGAAIDGSDADDELRIKVDGTINYELNVAQDDADEGGGRYIPVEIEAPTRGRDKDGNWGDQIAYLRGFIIGKAVDQILELEKKGVAKLCFKGYVGGEPTFIKDTPAYDVEIDEVTVSLGRGGDDDAFWSSKPKGLANRKSAASKSNQDKKRNVVDKKLDDELPF